ncbi:hypothetical protein Hanom_Chr11g01004111 [Helianthus anomalus]
MPGYYPSMEPSWSSSQFSLNAFTGFQQTPNAFTQMNQLQTMQRMQSLQQMMMQNPFNTQLQSQQPQPVESSQQPQPVEDDIEIVPETQTQSSKHKKGKQMVVHKDQPSKAKAKPWTRIEEEALTQARISTSKHPIVGM